jgi:hypothetical protein
VSGIAVRAEVAKNQKKRTTKAIKFPPADNKLEIHVTAKPSGQKRFTREDGAQCRLSLAGRQTNQYHTNESTN